MSTFFIVFDPFPDDLVFLISLPQLTENLPCELQCQSHGGTVGVVSLLSVPSNDQYTAGFSQMYSDVETFEPFEHRTPT